MSAHSWLRYWAHRSDKQSEAQRWWSLTSRSSFVLSSLHHLPSISGPPGNTWRKHLSVLCAANLKVHPTVPESSDYSNFWQLGNNPGVKEIWQNRCSDTHLNYFILQLPVSSTTFWQMWHYNNLLQCMLCLGFPLCCNIYWNNYCYTPDILCYSGIRWWESREPSVMPATSMLWLKTRSCTQCDC